MSEEKQKCYKYLVEETATKIIGTTEICSVATFTRSMPYIYFLCYHITSGDTIKTPFIQFMLEKMPDCPDVVEEQLILPFICLEGLGGVNLEEICRAHVEELLLSAYCTVNDAETDIVYNGVVQYGMNSYVLIDISKVDIYGLQFARDLPIWFALTTEIVNTREICGVEVEESVTGLFKAMPELGLLHNVAKNKTYYAPDVVYSGSEYKKVEFNAVFGLPRGTCKSVYARLNGEYFFFYNRWQLAVKDGGWMKEMDQIEEQLKEKQDEGYRKKVSNEHGKYIRGGLNRYAVFDVMYHYVRDTEEVTDELINEYDSGTVGILSTTGSINGENVIIKEYSGFLPLSYHILKSSALEDKYNAKQKRDVKIFV